MKIIYLILISMVCLNIQSCSATASEKETLDFKSVQQNKTIHIAEFSADRIKSLKDSGTILPLETILQQVQKDFPGRVIEVELEDEDNTYIYEIELVDKDNVVWELEIDAATGNVKKYEQDD